MKEQVLLYGVCAAISVAAVGVTSIIKIVVCAIAKRAGKDVSGNVKEYVFTPIAILLAGLGIYIWLDRFMGITNDAQFILTVLCGSFATMVIYWLIFQPTRKLAVAIIHAVAKKTNAEPIIDAIEEVFDHSETETVKKTAEETIAEEAADKLQAMVNAIKNK